MKISELEVVYTFANGQKIKASLQTSGWEQWGGTTEELSYTQELTETLSKALEEVIWEYIPNNSEIE